MLIAAASTSLACVLRLCYGYCLQYFDLDLFGSSVGSYGSAAFTVRSSAVLRAVSTVTAQPLHSLLTDRAQRVVVTADVVGGVSRPVPLWGSGVLGAAEDGSVQDAVGDAVARSSLGTFDHFEHVLYEYLHSAGVFASDAQREAFFTDLLLCNAQQCTASHSAAAQPKGSAAVEHVWQVQAHAAHIPFAVLNGVRSDWSGPRSAAVQPKPLTEQQKKAQAQAEKQRKEQAEKQRKQREAAQAKAKAAAAKKRKEWEQRQRKEEEELQIDGPRGARGPLGRLSEEPPAPAPAPATFGSEMGQKLRELAAVNEWPLAWVSRAGPDGRARVVLDVAQQPTAKALYAFDARCRFVRTAAAAAPKADLPKAPLDSAWQVIQSAQHKERGFAGCRVG